MKRTLLRALPLGFVLAVLAALFPFAAAGETLPDNVLRLRVVACSDSAEDQSLKLLVRDAVLAEAGRLCEGAQTLQEADSRLCLRLEGLKSAAETALRRAGSNQSVSISMQNRFYPTRVYEGFALPAGTYRALEIVLGEGQGQNWWCLIFPELCLPAASAADEALLTPGQQALIHSDEKGLRFRCVELFEELRAALAGSAEGKS